MEPESESSSPSQSVIWPLAVLGLVAFSLLFSARRGSQATPQNETLSPESSSLHEDDSLPNHTMGILSVPPTIPDDIAAERTLYHAPRWLKLIEIGVLLAAIGLLIVNIFEIRAARNALEAAKQANDLARDTLTKSNRAWMGIDGPLSILRPVVITHPKLNEAEPAQTQIQIAGSFVMRNFGRDPAVYVGVHADILTSQDATNAGQYAKDFREAARASCVTADLESTSVVAGEQGRGPTVLPGNQKIFSDYPFNSISAGQRTDVPLTIVGCISYRDQLKKIVHHTGFCFTSDVPMTAIVKGQPIAACPMDTEAN